MQSLNISTSALRAVQQVLDVTSNNIANVNTVGFKGSSADFSELLSDTMDKQPVKDQVNRNTPAGISIGSGVKLGMTRTNLKQGAVLTTEVPTDLMIEGDGMFMVRKQMLDENGQVIFRNGRPVEEYYATRNGNFHLQKNANERYNLLTATGEVLVDTSGIEIDIDDPEGGQITVNDHGEILVNGKSASISTIPLFKIKNQDRYERVGQNNLRITNNAADLAGMTRIDYAAGEGKLRQGMLETSNVELNHEMTQLMLAQRAYQFNARALSISDQMMSTANMLRSR
ncbi:flagellar hook-basal body protein [Brevibacillus laterosporus]|uniref:flagellar hook-basal body protein n=1 Tax=Brevibacillus laterosporus TaxID=1465 RepID=UPI002651DB0D|nr:flagellar hook-basal body protein [Brevibacillus laterosporus]MDN9009181.1 flagellar hook-basal body protein [Brevibacillus laterosporus]MDO0939950.1 flagellar hook-basal body protein [Brevibacillus laterosporus]